MVALLRRGLGQYAPTGPVRIDWGHPLAQDLSSCALIFGREKFFDHARDLVLYDTGAYYGDRAVVRITPLGDSFSTPTGGFEPHWPANDSYPIIPLDAMTVQVGVWATATHSGDYIGKRGAGADGTRFAFSTGGFDFGSVSNRATFSATPAHVAAHMAASGGPAGNRVYRNGVLVGSAGTNTSRTLTSGEIITFGSSAFAGTFNGHWSYAHIWRRQLPPDQIAWAAAEPYAFLTQSVSRRVFLMGSPAASTFRPRVMIA